jgi:hypothetical protein
MASIQSIYPADISHPLPFRRPSKNTRLGEELGIYADESSNSADLIQ